MTPNSGEVYELSPLPVTPGADFISLIGRVKDGEVAEQAGEALMELVKAVRATKKGGALSLSIKIAPIKGNAGTVSFEVGIVRKMPVPSVSAAFFYTHEQGTLHTSDPTQMKMFRQRPQAQAQQEERGEE